MVYCNSDQNSSMTIIAALLVADKARKKTGKPVVFRSFGGDKRDRTADLLNAIVMRLCIQLNMM